MRTTNLEFESSLNEIEQNVQKLELFAVSRNIDIQEQLDRIKERFNKLLQERYSNLLPWQRVLLARHPNRPLIMDYIQEIVEDFLELHGDRACGDDLAIICGLGRIGGEKIMLIGHQKGKGTREKLECNFGMAHPQGYRKAMRCMKLAEKFSIPVISLVDTPGAYPGVKAEKRGQAYCIAFNLFEMARLKIPVIISILGEGGSGGALGIGVGDRVLMMEHAYYSVISPEGCAAILWKSAEKAPEASEALRITAKDLKEFNVIDEIVPEPPGGAHRNPKVAASLLKEALIKNLAELKKIPGDTLIQMRYSKLRKMGMWKEEK